MPFYVLDAQGEPQPYDMFAPGAMIDLGAKFDDMANRRVAKTERGEVSVSTVFLMISYKIDGGPPALWETMIFGGEHHDYQDRARTLEEAILRHRLAVSRAFPEDPPETVWGTLPTLQPDGTILQTKVEVVVGPSFWERLMRDEDLV